MDTRTRSNASSPVPRTLRKVASSGVGITLFTLLMLVFYLMPFGYMSATAFKDRAQFSSPSAPFWPAREVMYEYEGSEYPLYKVPTEDGIEEWALIKKGREQSTFVNPNNLEAGPFEWTGRWRQLDPVWELSPNWGNFGEVLEELAVFRLLRNTIAIALIGVFGTLLSSIPVAYGFARYKFRGKGTLFMLLMATIILPAQVTLVPTYTFFSRIGWVGTWLPLTVPHFFANAYNVFWLRQYFMGIPQEIDEAAMIDGAGPLRILVSIILPQSIPAITAVALSHFVFAWNDFLGPMIYLSSNPKLQPLSVGMQTFNAIYERQPHLVQATSLLGLILPVIVFFLAQRAFMQGLVFTGVEK